VGIDVAPSMVRRAALANHAIPFRVGSFEAIPAGEGAFDAVIGGFVLSHVGSPEVAMAEAWRVLRPGGRLALAAWDTPRHNRLLGLFTDAITAVGAPLPAGLPAGPTHFRSSGELHGLFASAGFTGIGYSRIMFEALVPDLDTLWDGVMESAVRIPPMIARQPQAIRGQIHAAFEVLAAVHRRADGYAIPVAMQIIAGRRP
jgi:SAM-dependent methyltransferase